MEGRGRLSSLDMLPDEAQEDLVWACQELYARARSQAEMLIDQAIHHLQGFGPEADLLRAIARFAIERDR